jgi:hypothetical protein
MKRPNAQRAIKQDTSDVPHLPGTVLRTNNPHVGVLVEHAERRLVTTLAIPEGTVLFRIEGHETSVPTKYSPEWTCISTSAARATPTIACGASTGAT